MSNSFRFDCNHIIQRGDTLIFAPHPDDESLACGGLIALLSKAGSPPYVVFVSDGTMSHPGSKKFPAPDLMQLREAEALKALFILKVPPENTFFLRLKDSQVPLQGIKGFEAAVEAISLLFTKIKPATIVIPWRRDPHQDHKATWHLVMAAIKKLNIKPVVLEYPLWLLQRGSENDLPKENEVSFYTLDISSVSGVKQEAIAAHQSQTANIIDDDPQGFQLSVEMLAHFKSPYEIFMGKSDIFIK